MSLSAFLAENALSVENVKFVASKRFLSDELDDKGKRKPMEWEIKAITGTEDEPFGSPVPSGFPFPARKTSIRRKPTMICTLASWLWPVRCSPT
mgnify:CR=1 FL=1